LRMITGRSAERADRDYLAHKAGLYTLTPPSSIAERRLVPRWFQTLAPIK
jgi:hypothetical protein